MPFQPSYEDRPGAPDRVFAAVDDDAYERLVETAIEGAESFVAKREIIDEFGWRHYGDIYGDHEAVRAPDSVGAFGRKPGG